MNLRGAKWIGAKGTPHPIHPIFRATAPSGGMAWFLEMIMAVNYWRDFKRKHVHWTGIKVIT